MEMRRRARRTASNTGGTAARGRAERGVLTIYWLVSGYSLRAWRAFAWYAVVTALFAVAFHMIGFAKPPQPTSYWTSLLYAFRATVSLPDSDVSLIAWGQLLQGLLRLTGPVLLGLALLALRYLVIDMTAELEIELAVPVGAPVAGSGRVRPGVLPEGRYAMIRHTGPYDGLIVSNAALQKWAREHGAEFDTQDTARGSAWRSRAEHYLTDPSKEPDPATWEVDVAYLTSQA
jgi:hypothetical protein